MKLVNRQIRYGTRDGLWVRIKERVTHRIIEQVWEEQGHDESLVWNQVKVQVIEQIQVEQNAAS